MSIIVPTVMAETIEQLKDSIETLQPFAKRVHFDLADGDFAPTILVQPDVLYWPEGWQVDIHLMYARPSEQLAQVARLKPHMIILHAETQEDIVPHLRYIKEQGIRAGVALLKTTVPSTVEGAIKEADHVMIFSGDLGKFGGTASLMQLEKIRLVKKIKPEVEIGWDGGVSLENAYTLAQGGVDILNVGGAIAKAGSPADVYNGLVKEINKNGVI